MRRHNFADGDVIFREGEPSGAAFLITSGRVEIVRERKDGHPEVLAVLGKGEYFGEMGAIEEKPRSATAVAKGAVSCMSVSRDEFMDILLNRPQEAIDLLKVLFDRLRHANERLAAIEEVRG